MCAIINNPFPIMTNISHDKKMWHEFHRAQFWKKNLALGRKDIFSLEKLCNPVLCIFFNVSTLLHKSHIRPFGSLISRSNPSH